MDIFCYFCCSSIGTDNLIIRIIYISLWLLSYSPVLMIVSPWHPHDWLKSSKDYSSLSSGNNIYEVLFCVFLCLFSFFISFLSSFPLNQIGWSPLQMGLCHQTPPHFVLRLFLPFLMIFGCQSGPRTFIRIPSPWCHCNWSICFAFSSRPSLLVDTTIELNRWFLFPSSPQLPPHIIFQLCLAHSRRHFSCTFIITIIEHFVVVVSLPQIGLQLHLQRGVALVVAKRCYMF